MRKLPSTLTLSVPTGKKEEESFCTQVAMRYLLIAPKKPPIPTAKTVFIAQTLDVYRVALPHLARLQGLLEASAQSGAKTL